MGGSPRPRTLGTPHMRRSTAVTSPARSSADPKVDGRLAALGRFCFRHRRWVLGFWAVVLVIGVLIGGRVFAGSVAGASSASPRPTGAARWSPRPTRPAAP